MTNCSRFSHLDRRTVGARHRQRGAATLLIVFALTVACTALAISLAHITTLEQRMARNTLLAIQAQQAAIGGLNYASAWLGHERPAWFRLPNGREVATPAENPPALYSQSGESFAINLALERAPEWHGYVLVRSSASPSTAAEIEARASQFVRPTGVLTAAGEAIAPLVVDGCADLSAAGDLYPLAAGTPEAGPAVRSSQEAACIEGGGANLHGGLIQGEAFDGGGLWDHLFTVDRQTLEALAAEQAALPPERRDYWWARATDLAAGEWRRSAGSLERPVLLIVPAELGCPRFSGGAEIVGLVFIEGDCTGSPAWGDLRIHGGLAVTGYFGALGPYTRLAHISGLPGGPALIELPPLDVVQLAGSWRDF